eukprot:8447142-Pyramimonas_sp.AAC.1
MPQVGVQPSRHHRVNIDEHNHTSKGGCRSPNHPDGVGGRGGSTLSACAPGFVHGALISPDGAWFYTD